MEEEIHQLEKYTNLLNLQKAKRVVLVEKIQQLQSELDEGDCENNVKYLELIVSINRVDELMRKYIKLLH